MHKHLRGIPLIRQVIIIYKSTAQPNFYLVILRERKRP